MNVGGPETQRQGNGGAAVRSTGLATNSHIHLPPNFSAFESPEQAVAAASAEGIRVLGTANYYDYRVYARFAEAARRHGITPLIGNEIHSVAQDLRGIKVNDPGNPGQFNLCGKALTRFDPPNEAAAHWMGVIREFNDARAATMATMLAEAFSEAGLTSPPSHASITASVSSSTGMPEAWISLQERHLAEAYQASLFEGVPVHDRRTVLARLGLRSSDLDVLDPVAVQDFIRATLLKAGGRAFSPNAGISFEDARTLVLELGGVPCYPIFADAAPAISAFEDPPEELAEKVLARGLYCAELFPVRNKPEVVDRYVHSLRAAGIVIVAGTDHNTRQKATLTPTARGGAPLSDMAREAFWEGMCVLVAHQELAGAGVGGYVDPNGDLMGGYADQESRVRVLAGVGRDIIQADGARMAGGPSFGPGT